MAENAVVAEQPKRFEIPVEKPETPAPTQETPAVEPAKAEPVKTEAPAPSPQKVEAKTEPTSEDTEKRKTTRYERRLQSAYRKMGEAQAIAEQYKRQLEEAQKASAPPADPGLPRMEDFDDIDKFTEAKAKYLADKSIRTERERQAREHHAKAQREYQQSVTENWEGRVSAADEKYDDFDEVVGDLKPDNWFSMTVMACENAEDVAYHLGKNEKEAARIAALPPHIGIREIGKLEAKLAAKPVKAEKPSQAPEPIKPLEPTVTSDTDEPSDGDDMDTWIKKRRKQVYGNRGFRP